MDTEENAPLIHRGASSVDADVGLRTIRKLDWRFLLLLVIVVFLAYADRSNIGYAARDLCNELNLTNEEYGLGVSLFYIGYLLTQVIGNVLLERIGAPLWISFIVFFWGIVATTLGFIQNATQFYVLRVLLGVAEGGTFPAIWYIIPMFYPAEHITNAYSVIFSAIAFSMPLSSPISAGLLSLGPAVGVEGWRLLFIVEGLTPIFYALYFYFSFPPSLQEASFLNAEEKDWIASRQEKEERVMDVSDWEEIKAVLTHGPWRTCSLCFLILFGIYTGLMFWATLIIHEMLYGDDDDDDDDSKTCGSKHGNAAIAVLMTAIPYLMSGLACLLTRRYEVRNRSRLAAIMFGLSGVLLFSWVGTGHAPFGIRFVLLTLIISLSFVVSAYVTGLMMALSKVSAQSAAASLYNMIGTVGAVVFPLIFGKLLDVVGSEVAMVFPGGLSWRSFLCGSSFDAHCQGSLTRRVTAQAG